MNQYKLIYKQIQTSGLITSSWICCRECSYFLTKFICFYINKNDVITKDIIKDYFYLLISSLLAIKHIGVIVNLGLSLETLSTYLFMSDDLKEREYKLYNQNSN